MTQATGSKSQASPSKPWEQKWAEAETEVPVTAPKQAVVASNPWDKEWASNAPPDAPRNVPAASKAPPIATGEWADVNKKYAAGQGQRNQDQLLTLQAERAKEKDPKNIAMLDREIGRVQKTIKGN